MGWVATWGISGTTESFIPLKGWPLNPWQRKKQTEMSPSGVLKHHDGKRGRLFIVLPPSDPLLFDWLCPQDERSRALCAVFTGSDEALWKSGLSATISLQAVAQGQPPQQISPGPLGTHPGTQALSSLIPPSPLPLRRPPQFLPPLPPPLLPLLPHAKGCRVPGGPG